MAGHSRTASEDATLKTVSQTIDWKPFSQECGSRQGRKGEGWQDNTFYESLILAQDERWRRA